jgi:hypothetical protein
VKTPVHPAVARYLQEFDSAAAGLPLPRRRVLRKEIQAHLSEAIPVGLANDEARRRIDEFGSPDTIIGQELSSSIAETAPCRRKRGLALRAVVVAGLIGALLVAASILAPIIASFTAASAPTPIVNSHPTGGKRVTSGDAYYDYLATIKSIKQPLPPGAVYPVGVPVGLNSGVHKDGDTEFGAGADVAHFTWLCAWETEYLADLNDKNVPRRVTAEHMLEWWGNSAWEHAADPSHGWTENVIEPLRLGLTSGLKTDVQDSCLQAGIWISG